MKKENEKIEEVEVIDDVEVVEEDVNEEFFDKLKTGVKKHGKKIAIGTAVIAAGILGYKFGVNKLVDDDSIADIVDDFPIEDVVDSVE